MRPKAKLFEIADSQQGYFTSKQAEECGISRAHFHRKIRTGEWIKELRGIYRLAQYPLGARPELVLWVLWSRDKQGEPQGVWSHETALDIHELSDIMPSKMHMTVPLKFRKQVAIPKVLSLHFGTIAKKDVEFHHGYRVTTPLRTLIDVIEAGTVAADQIAQAIREGLNRGILSLRDINESPKLLQIKHDYKI
jgi:predicted transcriptional regulator of viral defense system